MDKDQTFWNEVWVELTTDNLADSENYQISNYGRIKSFKVEVKDGQIINGSNIGGYKTITLRKISGKRVAKYVHRLVAEHFIERSAEDQIYVIHMDYKKDNNYFKNLQWATKRQKEEHQNVNPNFVKTKKQVKYSKLTEAKVRYLKKRMSDPKRKTRLKMLAKQFGISEMQLYRIKRGENWGHVKVEED